MLLLSWDKQSHKSGLPYLCFLLAFKGLLSAGADWWRNDIICGLIGHGAKPLTEGLLLLQQVLAAIHLTVCVLMLIFCTSRHLPSSALRLLLHFRAGFVLLLNTDEHTHRRLLQPHLWHCYRKKNTSSSLTGWFSHTMIIDLSIDGRAKSSCNHLESSTAII